MDGKSKRAVADVWFSRGMCVYIYIELTNRIL